MYTLPNILTISRIAVIPLIFIAVYLPHGYNYFAGILFIGASVTDYYDGKLARERGEVSAFGRLLDPIADKLLVASALIVVLAKADELIHSVTFIPVFIILCRELLVSGLREFLREVNVGLPVTRLAKWKTGFQMTALSMIFFKGWMFWGGLGELLLWIAGGLTFYTGYQYFEKSLLYIRNENKKAPVKETVEVKSAPVKEKEVAAKTTAKKSSSKATPATKSAPKTKKK